MLIVDRKKFYLGSFILSIFIFILFLMFVPLFGPKRNMHFIDYAQEILNSLAKGSAYFIPQLKVKVASWQEKELDIKISLERIAKNPVEAEEKVWKILTPNLAGDFLIQEGKLHLKTDMAKFLHSILEDSELMYQNQGEEIRKKYDIKDERDVLRFWHTLLSSIERKLYVEEKRFAEAEIIKEVKIKAVEPSHNYYGTPPGNIRENPLPLAILLVWYIIYTIWYGVGTLYLFEGLGLTAKKPKKKREL